MTQLQAPRRQLLRRSRPRRPPLPQAMTPPLPVHRLLPHLHHPLRTFGRRTAPLHLLKTPGHRTPPHLLKTPGNRTPPHLLHRTPGNSPLFLHLLPKTTGNSPAHLLHLPHPPSHHSKSFLVTPLQILLRARSRHPQNQQLHHQAKSPPLIIIGRLLQNHHHLLQQSLQIQQLTTALITALLKPTLSPFQQAVLTLRSANLQMKRILHRNLLLPHPHPRLNRQSTMLLRR